MKSNTYFKVKKFLNDYPFTVAFRCKAHSKVIDTHLDSDEKVLYVFCGQMNFSHTDIFSTAVIALTNKRLLIGQKRVVFGYRLSIITPDLFNDMKINAGLFFGKIIIDTVKEEVVISNLSKHSMDEIETKICGFMIREKKKYASKKS